MTKVANLYAGPGAGKSTIAAHVFALLKHRGVNAELATEYAKDKVWENSSGVFDNQVYMFAKQHHRIHRLLGKVDVIITDSPLLLSLIYGRTVDPSYLNSFKQLVIDAYRSMDNYDIFINRVKEYNESGRFQKEHEAKAIDIEIKTIIDGVRKTGNYLEIAGTEQAAEIILKFLGY